MDQIIEALVRSNPSFFSRRVLGMSYGSLKAIVYPRPPYKSFTIKKRDGTDRTIHEPRKSLKIIQNKVLAFLEERSPALKPAIHGFVAKRSILTNALVHCSPKTQHVFNIDLEAFFPSITFYRVRGVLLHHPFKFSHQLATVIAHICTLDNVLPQGAPTSPFLSNLVCRSMDRDLANLARRSLARYSRYADDITFSFRVSKTLKLPAAVCSVDTSGNLAIGTELHDIIVNKHHFKINSAKTRLSDRARRMEVTGLTINRFPNVPRVFIDRIRGALNAWEKYGYDQANKTWQARVDAGATGAYEKKPWKRQTRVGQAPALKNVLWGKLLYLRMVRGKDDLIYTRLAERYNAVVAASTAAGQFSASRLPVEPVVRDKETALNACFVVDWYGDYKDPTLGEEMPMAQGTAFVYRELGLIITCNHVFEWEGQVGKVDAVIDYESPYLTDKVLQLIQPGTKKSWPAKIVFRDKPMDFAILAFAGEPPQHRYFSAMDAPIEPGAQGVLIGYPAWKQWTPPDFNDQKVLNRTFPHAGMNSFTITGAGSIRPGNSGGPFTDDRFRVAGMAQRGAYMGTGHDESLCFQIIDDLIDKYKTSQLPPPAAPAPTSAAPAIKAGAPPVTPPASVPLPPAHPAPTTPPVQDGPAWDT
ncbi:trypsin-like peptidase domain-containing protein [Burkholderia cenocepacia]|uniref:reverse transcriptase domain-containing protein n=1 Tax=Burkholderia cenocepacia TaxID=95486 RepID=UPI001B9A4118|nr:reverse transcriptase domain-containing protein [Burkholderia cenocepacia]MBR8378687.1 trypsin-like peptidase domain-containing protein [Burkholderia cenocepacia]